MKVIHIITGLENGGAEAVLFHLVRTTKNKNDYFVISLTSKGFYGDQLNELQVRVACLNMPRGRLTLKGLVLLSKLIKEFDPDIVQTWMYHADLIGGVIAKMSGVRKIFWGVHNNNLDYKKTSLSTRVVAGLCSLLSYFIPTEIIFCSESAKEIHCDLGYHRKKCLVISNGVDENLFFKDLNKRKTMRDNLFVSENDFLIGMVARWDPQKDHENFVIASSELVKKINHLKFIFVGEQMVSENIQLMRLLSKYQMNEHYILFGQTRNVVDIFCALDLHILSSSGEAFGNVSIEAMACETPVVMTDVGAGNEIVGETGWLVTSQDPGALFTAANSAINEKNDLKKWNKRKKACRERVVTKFSLVKMCENYQKRWEKS